MQLLRRYPIAPNKVLHYLDDGLAVYVIAQHSPTIINVFTFGLESLKPVRHYPLIFTLRPSKGCVDDDFLYMPDRYGYIMVYDKFSGLEVELMMSLSGVPAGDLKQSEKYVYVVCGVLLSNGVDIDTKHYCVCILNKETGNRSQTQLIRNRPLYVHPSSDGFWLVAGDLLQHYSDIGRMNREIEMPLMPTFEPIWTPQEVVYFNSDGFISGYSLEKLGLPLYGHRLPPSTEPPVNVKGRSVWAADHLYVIQGESVTKVEVPYPVKELVANDDIFGVDEAGELIRLDVESGVVTRSSLNLGLQGPLWSHGSILFASDREGHLCQILK